MSARISDLDPPCHGPSQGSSGPVVDVLVANHRRFLAFLQKRVGSVDVAEDLLQQAFVRSLDRAGDLRDQERATAWFYRLLRNALVDHYRKQGAESRALERLASHAEAHQEADETLDEELYRTVCACVTELLETLKPEYAAALRQVDLESGEVAELAGAEGITQNNAHVRLHRARTALRKQLVACCETCAEHGCVDCTCGARGA